MKGGESKPAPRRTDTRLKTKSGGSGKKTAAGKDPNKPKRPASAFFVFMEEFREKFKKEHPNNKSVATVGKAGGAKWKSMSEAEKARFVAKANKRKDEYVDKLAAYEKRLADGDNGAVEDDFVKSKPEVNDDEDDEDDEDDDEDEDDE